MAKSLVSVNIGPTSDPTSVKAFVNPDKVIFLESFVTTENSQQVTKCKIHLEPANSDTENLLISADDKDAIASALDAAL